MKRAHLQMQRKLARPIEVRGAWVRAVHEGRDLAARLCGRSTGPALGGLDSNGPADLAHLVRDLKIQTFPVRDASAMALAEAFLASARALHVSAMPERREAAARVLAEAAGALDDIIEADRAGAARGTWGRYGNLED